MVKQRYECKLFKTRDELASFMNAQIRDGWVVKEHSVILRGDETSTLLLSVIFERSADKDHSSGTRKDH
jgi:hypothetical protein